MPNARGATGETGGLTVDDAAYLREIADAFTLCEGDEPVHARLTEIAARLAELEGENAELRQDAERWRAFRGRAYICSIGPRSGYYISSAIINDGDMFEGMSIDSFADALGKEKA